MSMHAQLQESILCQKLSVNLAELSDENYCYILSICDLISASQIEITNIKHSSSFDCCLGKPTWKRQVRPCLTHVSKYEHLEEHRRASFGQDHDRRQDHNFFYNFRHILISDQDHDLQEPCRAACGQDHDPRQDRFFFFIHIRLGSGSTGALQGGLLYPSIVTGTTSLLC